MIPHNTEPKELVEFIEKSAIATQEKTEAFGLDPAWMKYGLPLVLLFLLLAVLWKMARWVEPKASAVVDGILKNADRTPGLLEAQAARDIADAARTEALLAAVRALNTLAEQLAQRVGAQSERTQLIATAVAQNNPLILQLTQSVAENSRLLGIVVEHLRTKE